MLNKLNNELENFEKLGLEREKTGREGNTGVGYRKGLASGFSPYVLRREIATGCPFAGQ